MRKNNIFLLIFIILGICMSCNQSSRSTRNNHNRTENNAMDTLFTESSANSIELRTISDLDFWLQDSISKINSRTCNRLLDAYNAAVVMNSLITDFDLQMRFEDVHEHVVKAIEHINLRPIKDAETLSKIGIYKQEMLFLLKVDADTINQDIHNPWLAKEDLYKYLSDKYYIETFGSINVDTLVSKYNNCPSVPDWDYLRGIRGKSNMVDTLEKRYRNANDFGSRCIYAIELAHAYEADLDSWPEGENPAISTMESLMNEQRFSYYLFELWQKWRVLFQDTKGSSKDSEIPNHLYNTYRKICAKTIFYHICEHPEDIMAINEFLLLSYEDNVLREGIYEYGNQNAIDKYNLFTEKYSKESDADIN